MDSVQCYTNTFQDICIQIYLANTTFYCRVLSAGECVGVTNIVVGRCDSK